MGWTVYEYGDPVPPLYTYIEKTQAVVFTTNCIPACFRFSFPFFLHPLSLISPPLVHIAVRKPNPIRAQIALMGILDWTGGYLDLGRMDVRTVYWIGVAF